MSIFAFISWKIVWDMSMFSCWKPWKFRNWDIQSCCYFVKFPAVCMTVGLSAGVRGGPGMTAPSHALNKCREVVLLLGTFFFLVSVFFFHDYRNQKSLIPQRQRKEDLFLRETLRLQKRKRWVRKTLNFGL